ncbi:23S rRNA (adenine(2503)-C(2))-methyltransferase RlmN [Streptobacillus moniliformis]|uniref:Probable dual-specificity RNA methyltransferase RlmN n=1 Tax=Streptobacillus moniliformis (strain ATCC 14647 / DSM 12112 / NCTC 10651 / 9901) TaxID=519441 RepID=D1AXP8_STRM9|nr:23S rRNA (adenine(2503)-C(2))-methyltransferase RlmN [Streptobacillus moniliformis]ACZ01074.1 radical SAM enzyme, Cfr family [Streptobacillus moniliformis DSM 12112]AVL42560.1 23S rRNA (adenine(2503)-C(2))-methyltransferase RlmN [Streptobacillus moniliformis]SQA13784.1 Ribosomal RNA large subunit methyltransferase N [Streptobacillus moniliformis]
MVKIDILDLSLDELEKMFLELGLKKFNALQVYQWLHKKLVFNFDEFSNISKETRELLKEKFEIGTLKYVTHQTSKDKETVKFLFSLPGKKLIESVLLKYKNRYSICVSSQVGCPLKCDFCATGMMKFEKNLKASEILMQFYYLQNYLKEKNDKISNVVYMGMGEPFLNYDAVNKSINILNSKEGQAFSKRNFTISTSGLINEIDKFVEDQKQVGLAISLHSVNEKRRSELMPINKINPLDKLRESLLNYQNKTKNRITFEYILIDDFNCEKEDAVALVKFMRSFNHLVNLIPYNKVAGKPYKTPSLQKQKEFYNHLLSHKINVTLRETKGEDIQAACGQLKVKKEEINNEESN